jgi:hypothetical protein
MSGLLVLPGFPVTNAGGTEGLGVGIDTATGFTVAPDGTVATPVAIKALIAAELAAGASTLALAKLYRQPNSF